MKILKRTKNSIHSVFNKIYLSFKKFLTTPESLGVFLTLSLFVFFIFLHLVFKLEFTTLLNALIGFIIALIPLLFYILKKRDQTLIMSFTTNYLIEEDFSRLDELLGILIAGRFERLKIDPLDKFYESLEDTCKGEKVEMRRRITEALPALYKIDLERTKDIVNMLRYDWDDKKWKSDNRRRVIESLSYVIKKDKNFVLENLKLREKDEFFVLIAILEILFKLKRNFGLKDVNKFFDKFNEDIKQRKYSVKEIGLIKKMWEVLNMIDSSIESVIGEFYSLRNSEELYLQIFCARNFRLLCDGYPRCIKKRHCFDSSPERSLDFMQHFLSEDRHKYARRPISKEDSLECLVILLKYPSFRTKVIDIIWALFQDGDDIIRITSFDKIDNILEVDNNLGKNILSNILKNEKNERLVKRAENIIKRRNITLA